MSQYNRSSNNGRSRARGTSSSRTTRSSTARTQNKKRSSSGRNRKNGSDYEFKKIAIGGVLLIAMITCIVFLVKGMGTKAPELESESETTTEVAETELQKEVTVDGIDITGMSREDAKAAILKNYTWSMKITNQDQTYEVRNLMAGKADALLQEIFSGEPKDHYTLDTSGLEEAVKEEVAAVAAMWDKKAKNGSISSYDVASDKFLFTGAESGLVVDQEALAGEINKAIRAKTFDVVIAASVNQVEPEFSEAVARDRYKTVATFTTKTTANNNRNTNIKLSAQALNGTVLQPGEEFSFNQSVGERTAAKGYKGAAAYSNGEVVEEIGGGVCQLSSTLYNAVLRAGLKTTVRRSHTYEPSYVSPGTDATVSWGGPDYKFVNNSSAAIGIRASYSNQTTTVSIYAIPILEDGVKYSLESKKLKDTDPPAATYEEDQTLEPGVEKTKSAGSRGSYWETRLVITKNGETVSREVTHNTTYRGHAPVILRNTSGTVVATEGESSTDDLNGDNPTIEAPSESGDGQGSTVAPGNSGNGPGASQTTEASTAAPGPGSSSQPTNAAPPQSTTAAAPPTEASTTAAAPPATDAAAPPPAAADETIQVITPMPGS